MANTLAHLHVHSDNSLLDGLGKIPLLVKEAKRQGMPALALTDHGVLFGAIEFYTEADKAGIKPILGYEAYVTDLHRSERAGEVYHLTLLADSLTGYKNLVQLTSKAHLEGFYRKPRIDHELLSLHSEGVICLSGCASSEISEAIRADNMTKAKELADWYRSVFGDRFYMEVQHHGLDFQDKILEGVLDIGKSLGIPFVATNDVHYVDQSHGAIQEVLLCVQTQTTMSDPKRMKLDSHEFYLKSYDQMASRFGHIPGALENTLVIADRCNVELSFERLPLPIPPISNDITPVTHMKRVLYKGLLGLYGDPLPENVIERAKYELSVIDNAGYTPYFLLVSDFIQFARSQGIAIGVRGSVGGSLVSYGLRITDIDPLLYDLSFERFLNPDRVSMPDIDIDIADDRRSELLDYITNQYGHDKVAQIITFQTMKPRVGIRNIGRALDVSLSETDKWAKMIPSKKPNQDDMDLDYMLENNSEFIQAHNNSKNLQEIVQNFRVLEGVKQHAGTHAAGIVIASDPIMDTVPLFTAPRLNGAVVTQYSMEWLEKVGLLKMDILGLRTLSIAERACRMVSEQTGFKLDYSSVPTDDPDIFTLIGSGNTFGIFQLGDSGGMRRLVRNDRPQSLSEVATLVALYRPGPIQFLDSYVRRHHGQEDVTYPHPIVEEALKETYGLGIYQEQIVKLVQLVGGFTPGKADEIRKAVGKKKIKEMQTYEPQFVSGAQKKGISKELAQEFWGIVNKFAGYGFNKAHAVAYATLACRTAYLKAKFPHIYMVSLLSAERQDQDKVTEGIAECRRMNIEILNPDVNRSGSDFTLEGQAIRFGLSAIKGLGDGVAEKIVSERTNHGEYNDFLDFIRRHNTKVINKRTVEALAKAGAFDLFGERSMFVKQVDVIAQYVQDRAKFTKKGQLTLFSADQYERLYLMPLSPATRTERLAWEKESVGTYLSENLLKIAEEKLEGVARIVDIDPSMNGTIMRTGGVILEVKEFVTKKGDKMARVKIADVTGSISVIVFPRQYASFKEYLVSDAIVVVKGKVQINEEEVEILAESLGDISYDEPLPEIEQQQMKVYISMIPTGDRKKDNMTYVKVCNAIQQHPGEDSVVFRAVDPDGMVNPRVLPLKFNRVKWDSYFEDTLAGIDKSIQISTIE